MALAMNEKVQLSVVWLVFLCLVPILHVLATLCTTPKHGPEGGVKRGLTVLKAGFQFPFAGGPRTLVFQALSWILLCISVLIGKGAIQIPCWDGYSPEGIPPCGLWTDDDIFSLHVYNVLGAMALFSAPMSVAFMVKSILVFDPKSASHRRGMTGTRAWWWRQWKDAQQTIEWDVSCLPSKLTASYVVVILGLLWSLVGVGLLFAQPLHGGLGTPLGTACYIFSVICFILSAFTIHGLGGLLRHTSKVDSESDDISGSFPVGDAQRLTRSRQGQWKFWMPFKGGAIFVATQATGWVLMSSALAVLFVMIAVAITRTAEFAQNFIYFQMHSLTITAGVTALIAECVLALSLLFFNARNLVRGKEPISTIWHRVSLGAQHILVMSILYIPMHITLAVIVSSFFIVQPLTALVLWIGILPIYYMATGIGFAEKTGSREWPAFQKWLGGEAERVLPMWFGSLSVQVEQGATFHPDQSYVFGYLPHGLYPLGAAYLPILPSFRKLFPDIKPATLSASIVFQLPVLRDLLLWTGLREVTRSTFKRTLRERKSLILVPGGQAELVETHKFPRQSWLKASSTSGHCAFYSGHKGFVRLALQEGAHLVPIIVFGEVTSLRNFIDTPRLHRWTYKVLGFPLPYLIGGKFGVLPFPSRHGLKFIIGRPIKPPRLHGELPTEEQVSHYHEIFYNNARDLWNEHRKNFPGYENIEAILV